MKIRWLLIAVGLVLAMTAIAWLPMRSAGRGAGDEAREAGASGERGAGCPANARPTNLDFTLKDMYGRDVKLADYRGKVLLINFWATWCGPCQAEIPAFVDLQAKYKKQGFEIVGISINDEMHQLPPFAREFRINYPLLVGLDRDDVLDAFGPIGAIPVTMIVGRDGKMCYKKLGLADVDQVEREIKSLL
jgi:cytochrome c biogenesis protein CcmG, thiol:disulfide interchange protein DsbE